MAKSKNSNLDDEKLPDNQNEQDKPIEFHKSNAMDINTPSLDYSGYPDGMSENDLEKVGEKDRNINLSENANNNNNQNLKTSFQKNHSDAGFIPKSEQEKNDLKKFVQQSMYEDGSYMTDPEHPLNPNNNPTKEDFEEILDLNKKEFSFDSKAIYGKIVEFDKAPFEFNKENNDNFYIKLFNSDLNKDFTIWGKEIEKNLSEGNFKKEDFISIKHTGVTDVTVDKPIFENGKVARYEKIPAQRNSFSLNKVNEEDYSNYIQDKLSDGKEPENLSPDEKFNNNKNTNFSTKTEDFIIPLEQLDKVDNDLLKEPVFFNSINKELLSKGQDSELIENIIFADGSVRDGKFSASINKDGDVEFLFKEKKQILIIPDKIGSSKLSDEDKIALKNNEFILIKHKNNELYVQVDNELNSIVVKEPENVFRNKNIVNYPPDLIGADYFLTKEDKECCANNKPLPPRLFLSDNKQTYFVAQFFFDKDTGRRGFTNIKIIENHQEAMRLKAKLNTGEPLKAEFNNVGNIIDTTLNIAPGKQIENSVSNDSSLLSDAILEMNVSKVKDLLNKGAVPTDSNFEAINHALYNSNDNKDVSKLKEIEGLLSDKKPVSPSAPEKEAKTNVSLSEKERQEFIKAIDNKDLPKIAELTVHQKLHDKQILNYIDSHKKLTQSQKNEIKIAAGFKADELKNSMKLNKPKASDMHFDSNLKNLSNPNNMAKKLKRGIDKGKGLVHDM